jgi:HK97 family phage major capsid protein/HK97 family phage prohead protease
MPEIKKHTIAPGEVRFKASATEGVFSGYAAVFNELVPSYGERVMPGAFTRTITEWRSLGKKFPILAAHDPGRVIGLIDPTNLLEDERGLFMKDAELILETQDGAEHFALIKRGLVSLSIGFWPMKWSINQDDEFLIEDAELAEISVVYAGASPNATITEIRSQDTKMPQETKPEQTTPETTAPEKRSQAAPQPAAEVLELRSQVAELRSTVEELEVRSQRPGRQTEQPSEERAAFGTYLRFGNGAPAEQIRALTVSSDPNGGYLAPAEMSTEFLRDLVEFSPVRSVASVRSTSAPSVSYPKRTSGTNAKWKGETQAQEESTISFGQAEIPVHEINTYVDISNQLLADSAGQAEAEVRMALAEDFGKKEGAAFVNGDGVLSPKGFMSETSIAHTLNGHATNLSAEALITLMYAQPASYRSTGVWAMNGTTLGIARKLKDPGTGSFLWQPSFQAGQPETLLGRPVIEMVDMPDVADGAFPIAYGDFQAYRIVDRVGLSVLVNPYLLATNGVTRIHATRRVGGGVLQAARFRKLKMATS